MPLAAEKLQRQLVSVFCGTEHGDASLAVMPPGLSLAGKKSQEHRDPKPVCSQCGLAIPAL